jgi:hypothetical protein
MAKKEERPDILIDGNIATWELKMEGDIQGTYTGIFKFKCFLTPTQQLTAGREYRELLGSNPTLATEHESLLAYALSQLKQRVIQSPPFWNSSLNTSAFAGDVPDENVISAILDAAIGAELKYKKQLKAKRLQAIDKAKKAAERMLKKQEQEDNEGESEEGSDKS